MEVTFGMEKKKLLLMNAVPVPVLMLTTFVNKQKGVSCHICAQVKSMISSRCAIIKKTCLSDANDDGLGEKICAQMKIKKK
jgi:hypothetical protein